MDLQRRIEPGSFERSGRRLARTSLLCGGLALVAIIAAVAVSFRVPLRQAMFPGSKVPVVLPEPEAFARRFPPELGTAPQALQRDAALRRHGPSLRKRWVH